MTHRNIQSMTTSVSIGSLPLTFLLSLCLLTSAGAEFVPAVEGKKILLMDGPPSEEDMGVSEDVAIDGLLIGGPMIMYYPCKQKSLDEFADNMRKRDWGRLTDNFWVCWSYAGKPGEFDWFDDMSMIVENFRMAAAAVKKAGFKGLAFDSELYAGVALFKYHEGLKYFDSKTLEEYQEQAFKRGAEIMRAINESYPDITIFFLFGGRPSKDGEASYTGLLGPFVDGFLSECGPDATVVDGNEGSYYASTEANLVEHRTRIREKKLACSKVPEKYSRHLKVGLGIWPDAGNKECMSFDINEFQNNYRTPDELAYTLHHALRYTDEYVWLWRGDIKWLKKMVSVIDDRGKSVHKPLPEGYVKALQRARDPNLSLPTARGFQEAKASMRGYINASELPGWSDEETFGDMWDKFEHICDLPLQWHFKLDPKETGLKGGWHEQSFDDARWPKIEIKQFWERQGYAYKHYDGSAWYRTEFNVPKLPQGKRMYLAFGAVNDKASVHIDGKLVSASEVGRQDMRFLIDVTGLLKSEETSIIAVQVTGRKGLGGIWKNVKLVTEK